MDRDYQASNIRKIGTSAGHQVFLKNLKTVKNEKPECISLYRHATLDTDLSVHILWETEKSECFETPLGTQLQNAFLNFGLSTHTLWLLDETVFQYWS